MANHFILSASENSNLWRIKIKGSSPMSQTLYGTHLCDSTVQVNIVQEEPTPIAYFEGDVVVDA